MYRFMLLIRLNINKQNDSAKYHFLIQLISNWKISTWVCDLTKDEKKVLNLAAANREENFQHVLSSLCMHISVYALKFVYAYSWLIALVVHNVSLASIVPTSSHYSINNSPLSSTLRYMTILQDYHIFPTAHVPVKTQCIFFCLCYSVVNLPKHGDTQF